MAVYRFRVFIEDNHEIYRDIEILGRHDFADLHRAIVKHFNFEHGQPAEYLTSDSTWYEGDDIVSLDGNQQGKPTRIVTHVNDPHQRFLCVTMSFKQVGLAIELLRIIKDEEEGAEYPRMVKSHGDAPFFTQPPVKPIISDVPDDDEDEKKPRKKGIASMLDDEPTDDQIGEEDTDMLNDDTESDPDAPAGDDDDDLGEGGSSDDDDEDGEGESGFSNFDMDEL